MVEPWTITALRPDVPLWRTSPTRRTVLAVAHTVTAAARLFDVLPVIAIDPRLQFVFTCTGTSPFAVGTTEYLTQRGALVVPWDRAVMAGVDLAIAASYGGELHRIACPLVVVTHGFGYNKYKPTSGELFGMSEADLLHKGRLVPTVIVMSHEEQVDRLRATVPVAADAAVVAGDPCYDALVASGPLRDTYREAFGVGAGQRLVVVASTWGPSSLFAANPALAARLAASLSPDRYRIVVALHPNIRAAHSSWQLDLWLEDWARAGVLVLADEGLWRQAVVAADLVVGDHGSVTFYSAAIGRPVLLAGAPEAAVDPRSPVGMLLAAAPRLVPGADVGIQVDAAVAGHQPERFAGIAALTSSQPGQADHRLRELVYGLLDLDPPDVTAGPTALPVPTVPVVQADGYLVDAALEPRPTSSYGADDVLVVSATRSSLSRIDDQQGDTGWITGAGEGAHVVADVRAGNTRLVELADVVVHPLPADAAEWIRATLRALPACVIATAPDVAGRWLAGTTDGLLVAFDPLGRPPVPSLFASALFAWRSSGGVGRPPSVVHVRAASGTVTAHVTTIEPGVTAPQVPPGGVPPPRPGP